MSRAGTFLLWYVLPSLAAAAVLAYVSLAILWHANPPAVPVAGVSMRPTLEPGDLVLVQGVDPSELREGDIIAFEVPEGARSRFNLPRSIVHRIAELEQTESGIVVQTKGDANPGEDAFSIRADKVIGRMKVRVPAAGYPLLFFRSRQGMIFLGATALVVVLYFLLGVLDARRELSERGTFELATLVEEARALTRSMHRTADPARGPPEGAVSPTPTLDRLLPIEQASPDLLVWLPRCSEGCHLLPPGARFDPHTGEPLPAWKLPEPPLALAAAPSPAATEPDTPPETPIETIPEELRAQHVAEFQLAPAYREEPPEVETPREPTFDFGTLERELHEAVANGEDVRRTMRELVGAVGEYGEHLRSHTEVIRNLAASTGELQAAASEIREVLGSLAQVLNAMAEQQRRAGEP